MPILNDQALKYGYCLNHPKTYAVNAKRLCKECTKGRHERCAAMKGMEVKKNRNYLENEIEDGNDVGCRLPQDAEWKPNIEGNCSENVESDKKKQTSKKVAYKIKPRSDDKKKEIEELSRIKKHKISIQGSICEMCGDKGQVDLFHIITVGDKKHSTNPQNLLLSCRRCHLIWTANDWEKIVRFSNFNYIMERLKSLDEGRYWKIMHKLESALKTEYYKR